MLTRLKLCLLEINAVQVKFIFPTFVSVTEISPFAQLRNLEVTFDPSLFKEHVTALHACMLIPYVVTTHVTVITKEMDPALLASQLFFKNGRKEHT